MSRGVDDPSDEAPEFEGFSLRAVDAAGPGGQRFWRRIEHAEVVPPVTLTSVIRDLFPEAREEEWARGPGAVGPPTRWQRPSDVEEAMEEQNPQFCLRNLHRHEMDAWPNDLWWQIKQVRTTLAEVEAELEPSRTAVTFKRGGSLLEQMSYDRIVALKNEHQALTLHTQWSGFTWRRGPRDDIRTEPDSPAADAID